MSEHWNIQISIQRVEDPRPVEDSKSYTVKNAAGPVMSERKVVKVLDLAITAGSEYQAHEKAHRLLSASLWNGERDAVTDSETPIMYTPKQRL